ncbi:MAG: abortive infection family protein [Microthrixaceae bacterium]
MGIANKIPNGEENGLTNKEVLKIVNQWIGVEGGYLGDFSYRTHDEFWLEECDITVSTGWFEGTTRECFIDTLSKATSHQQADAVDALLERFSGVRSDEENQRLRAELINLVARLRTGTLSAHFSPGDNFDAVNRAIGDARELVKSSGGYQSAVDRMHTALHGYVRVLAKQNDDDLPEDADLVASWKSLLTHHPSFGGMSVRRQDIKKATRSLTAIIDVLNPIRNRASNAHPNELVLEQAEAMLIVNLTNTIALYTQAKLRESEKSAL